jgi:hypothetical protein
MTAGLGAVLVGIFSIAGFAIGAAEIADRKKRLYQGKPAKECLYTKYDVLADEMNLNHAEVSLDRADSIGSDQSGTH